MLRIRFTLWILPRILFGVLIIPQIQKSLFLPFFENADQNVWDPWTAWISVGGHQNAFPYGGSMFLVFLPAILMTNLIVKITSLGFFTLAHYMVFLTLLLLDFLFSKKMGLFSDKESWAWAGIFSPLFLYITYIHGQFDLIPAFFLFIALMALKRESWKLAGFWLGIAVTAKFSIGLALPFVLIYFFKDRYRKTKLPLFLITFIPFASFVFIPVIWSHGYRTMVLGTPEIVKSLNLSLDFGNVRILILPVIYATLLAWYWNLPKITSKTFFIFTGASLLALSGAQTNSIGWFYWGLPIVYLVALEAKSKIKILLIFWQFSTIAWYALMLKTIEFSFVISSKLLADLLFTLNAVILVFILLSLIGKVITLGDRYSLISKPIAIAIAGDSGSGKDTLASGISKLVGDTNINLLLGDDYHLYERGDNSWLTTTHLDPSANDLSLLGKNFQKALGRNDVYSRHYDHKFGKFTSPRLIKSGDFVLINGLHSFLIPNSNQLDLKVFMLMDENLRIQKKIERDSITRGHVDISAIESAIEIRKPDYQKYVAPQMLEADIVFKVEPISMDPLLNVLYVKFKDYFLMHELKAALLAVTNCGVEIVRDFDEMWLRIEAYNFQNLEGIPLVHNLIQDYDQILNSSRAFLNGDIGLMSVITLISVCRKRYN